MYVLMRDSNYRSLGVMIDWFSLLRMLQKQGYSYMCMHNIFAAAALDTA